MAIDFPASPTVGQTYTYNGKTWEWTGQYWDSTDVASTGGCYVDSIPPPSPTVGDMWYDTTTGRTYIWNDNVWSEMTGVPSVIDASTLTGTTMAPNVINYPSHTVLRQSGSATEGGQIDLQGGTSHPGAMFIDRYQDTLRIVPNGATPRVQIANDLVSISSADDIVLSATDDLSLVAGDQAWLTGANVTVNATTRAYIQSGGLGNIDVTSSDIGINPGGAGGLWVNARPARVLVGQGGPTQSVNGMNIPAGTMTNLWKFTDIPVRNGDTLIVRGFLDFNPSVTGWAFAEFMCVNGGGGDIRFSLPAFDSNMNSRRVLALPPLHCNWTYDTTVQVWTRGYVLNGTCAAQAVIWSYEIYGTR